MIEPAPYRFQVVGPVDRDLAKMPESVAAACVEFMATVLVHEPYRVSKALVYPPWIDYRSARRGEYRLIFHVDDTVHVITVVRVAHRSVAYRGTPPA